jgi:hypothetical protein
MKEAVPVSETGFELINKGKFPRLCISLMTYLNQKPLDRPNM